MGARNRYSDYSTEERPDTKHLVHYSDADGGLARMHFRAWRVPSQKLFIIRHFADATPTDRAFAKRWLERMPNGGWEGLPAQHARKFWNVTHYVYQVPLGHLVSDPFLQLELEMMIDSTRDVSPR